MKKLGHGSRQRAIINPLSALTATALALPGMLYHPAHADDEGEVDFQYSHYQEGKRDIAGMAYNFGSQKYYFTKLPNKLNPIEVDSLHGSTRITLTDRVKFAFNYTQDTWSGATPVATAPSVSGSNRAQYFYTKPDSSAGIVTGASPLARDQGASFLMDRHFNFYQYGGYDPVNNRNLAGAKNNRLVHTMAFASPETRKQGDFNLSYEWGEASVNVGGGISVENDYESRFVNLDGKMDFNGKQTTVNAGLSYTNSDTQATLDPDALQFIDTLKYDNSELGFIKIDGEDVLTDIPKTPQTSAGEVESTYQFGPSGQFNRTQAILLGNRQDWSSQLGLTQVLNKNAVLELGMNYTRSTGYLGNPYKLVSVIRADPTEEQLQTNTPFQAGRYSTLEIRPDERNQFNWNVGYHQYVELMDAAFHFNYRFSHDDWDINAHTLDADWVQSLGFGWTVTPRIRYYSQSNAFFYAPIFKEIYLADVYNPITGELVKPGRYLEALPANYSSDQRLSGFGTLSGGVTVAKQFGKAVGFEAGFEYYTHQGDLKLGGGGEQAFADFAYWVTNAALKVKLDALASAGDDTHSGHRRHWHSDSPAGVMFDHALKKAGDFMVGYRYMRSDQAGNMLHGNEAVTPEEVRFNGCGDQECVVAPKQMAMNMHMLELMYAPADWLTLMLMPQWTDMEMEMLPLVEHSGHGHNHGGPVHNHQTGGVGDTGLYALFQLFDQPRHNVTLSLGGTAPTGDDQIMLRKTNTNPFPAHIHYGMQLGSGTWDFKPSLTYSGNAGAFTWGAQATGTLRLQSRNDSNFRFGDSFQGSLWGGYRWTNWLQSTLRGVYTWQDDIHGGYPPIFDPRYDTPYLYTPTHVGPFDRTVNYGGRFVDLGLGLNVTIPYGAFTGHSLKFEWLQPLHTDYNGYQLERDGALSVTWGYGF